MKTFNHNELDYLMDHWQEIPIPILDRMLKGKHFTFTVPMTNIGKTFCGGGSGE